jgi:hypothetical protein
MNKGEGVLSRAPAAAPRRWMLVARWPTGVQDWINRLGNPGNCLIVHCTRIEPVEADPVDQLDFMETLVADMHAGRVDTLIVLGATRSLPRPPT